MSECVLPTSIVLLNVITAFDHTVPTMIIAPSMTPEKVEMSRAQFERLLFQAPRDPAADDANASSPRGATDKRGEASNLADVVAVPLMTDSQGASRDATMVYHIPFMVYHIPFILYRIPFIVYQIPYTVQDARVRTPP